MGEDHAPRGVSSVRCRLGYNYRSALTDNQGTNQGGIRVTRTTSDGFDVMGHAHFHSELLDKLVDNVGDVVVLDVDEIPSKLLIVENGMNEAVTLNLYGVTTSLYFLIAGPIVLAAGATHAETVTDPWQTLQLDLVGPAVPTGGNVVVEGERQT